MMLDFLYSLVSPWAKSGKAQIFRNRVVGVLANVLYRPYCKLFKIKQASNDSSDVIVSLTTYPARIEQAYFCLNSLLRQSVSNKQVILWLAKGQFPNGEADLPKRILSLKNYGLQIKFCDDFHSYKKIFCTAQQFSDCTIVTADDDTLYPESWLKKLIETHEEHPDCVVCYRAHNMTFENGRPLPYSKWQGLSKDIKGPLKTLVPIGVGGVLYPPHFFDDVCFDYSIIERLAPTTDDIWLKVLAMKNEVSAVKVNLNSKEWFTVKGSQKTSLKSINVDQTNANDVALKNLMEYYNL